MNWLHFKIKRSEVIVTVRLHASFIFLSKPVCSQIEIIQNYNKQPMGKLERESISGNVLLGKSVEMSAETCMGNVQIRMQAYRFLHLVVTVCDTLVSTHRDRQFLSMGQKIQEQGAAKVAMRLNPNLSINSHPECYQKCICVLSVILASAHVLDGKSAVTPSLTEQFGGANLSVGCVVYQLLVCFRNMPEIDILMQEWPAEFEDLLKDVSTFSAYCICKT